MSVHNGFNRSQYLLSSLYLPAMDEYIMVRPARPNCAQVKQLMRN